MQTNWRCQDRTGVDRGDLALMTLLALAEFAIRRYFLQFPSKSST